MGLEFKMKRKKTFKMYDKIDKMAAQMMILNDSI